ncbi:glycerophosphodiester phosphodiesterase GDPDL7, partial [Tanacetum coccineum]
MSKDGVTFCLDSADLLGKTNAAMSFMDRSTLIPEIQPKSAVLIFDLTWTEIKSVKPPIAPPQVTDVVDPLLPLVNAGARKDSDKAGGGGSSES